MSTPTHLRPAAAAHDHARARDDDRGVDSWVRSGHPWTVVHDFAYADGGAELVTRALADQVLGGAPVRYLSGRADVARSLSPVRSRAFLRAPVPTEQTHRFLTPAYPVLTRGLPAIPGHVIASSYAFAHHVRCTGVKIVYCHSPLRQVWSAVDAYRASSGLLGRAALAAMSGSLRRADVAAARSADLYVATSEEVRRRIQGFYGLEDVPVVAPPVDQSLFSPLGPAEPAVTGRFLWVGRVVEPYKRLGVVVDAFRGLDEELVVVGDGRDRQRLEETAPPNVRFVGWRDRSEIARMYRSADALVFPSEDDFGLVPVEAMSSGTPVLAYRRGGALDTVSEGLSGLFFEHQSADAVRDAVLRFRATTWQREAVVEHASRFGLRRFAAEMSAIVGHVVSAAQR